MKIKVAASIMAIAIFGSIMFFSIKKDKEQEAICNSIIEILEKNKPKQGLAVMQDGDELLVALHACGLTGGGSHRTTPMFVR